jgi:hypothetical protein
MGKFASKLNFGWGKQMSFAGELALKHLYGQGHFATVAAHSNRWDKFVGFVKKEMNIKNATKLELSHIERYGSRIAKLVATDDLSVAYGQNLLSSVNTTLEALRGNRDLYISPSYWIGKRSTIRETPPVMDKQFLSGAIDSMIRQGFNRGAYIALLARELGLRSKEASLINSKNAIKQAKNASEILISSGTKGGRSRKLKILHESQVHALQNAAITQNKAANLIPSDQSWIQWKDGELRSCREILKIHGIPGFHELRAAYACERYEEIMGTPAPVFGSPIRNRDSDYEARLQIAHELGHGRIDVLSEYIGGRK